MKVVKRIYVTVASVGFVLTSFCYGCREKEDSLVDISKVNVTYTESEEDFPNPERGFYRYSETSASNFVPLDASSIKGYRNLQSIENANYQVLSTLLFRYYILDNLKNAAIPVAILNGIKTDMQAIRTAGLKVIPRFVYTVTSNAGNCAEGGICPPYGDASKAVVLNHIAQLKPLLQENADVITCVQFGFIGIWGENYYSDYFGDPSPNGNQQNVLSDQNWQDRIDVLKALLGAVPADRMVQVRYPQFKQRFAYGVHSLISSAALSEQEAFTATDKSRIGYHNDCFLSGSNDVGTFEDYGNNLSPRSSDAAVVNTLRDYMMNDSRFVVVGGETCSDGYSPQNDCEPAGKAQEEFAAMHYSYINAHYNNTVNNDWQDGGCMDNIKRNLGYRLVLESAVLPDNAVRKTEMNITLNIRNKGYAAPYNPRPVQVLLRSKSSGEVITLPFDTDIRRWYSGAIMLQGKLRITGDITPGDYELLLNLPDAYSSLAGKPEYSIRLANKDVWEETTGYNKLNHVVQVK
ncbi:uncharacterized protein DUF4874 [Arcticibacter tournemirensis]|uniref:DUF4832 domain-containing protein n=1 Tax=Arcticibacter tournemirensis TaxID=699437 RepID=A0A5M9H9N4_9SPHI|nr:DUF4832 domain-containing protein [Arcticibacter tournemirensis]KAA8483079.1 DUF4832 domain-containing protein [Arcticibacter tournemirensis]TQM52008.1 uncharacterized protein DUF4874 [Arcticibacter tournemirensis]